MAMKKRRRRGWRRRRQEEEEEEEKEEEEDLFQNYTTVFSKIFLLNNLFTSFTKKVFQIAIITRCNLNQFNQSLMITIQLEI